jgi:hypothetical protein
MEAKPAAACLQQAGVGSVNRPVVEVVEKPHWSKISIF